MNKKILKIVLIFIIVTTYSFLECMAAGVTGEMDDFTADYSITSVNTVANPLASALRIIQIIGYALALIMIVALAIKYMVSSVSDRAEIKKHAIIYVLGAVLMFMAAGIVGIIRDFAAGL